MTNTTTAEAKLSTRQIIEAVRAKHPGARFIPGYGGGTWVRSSSFDGATVDEKAERMFIALLDANGYVV